MNTESTKVQLLVTIIRHAEHALIGSGEFSLTAPLTTAYVAHHLRLNEMLLSGGMLVSTEVKFSGPLQIPTARNKRCEYYSSHILTDIMKRQFNDLQSVVYVYIFLLSTAFNIYQGKEELHVSNVWALLSRM